MTKLTLIATHAATTYSFRAAVGEFSWACCTVNDATGELAITSDWGNWSHRWSANPEHLGAPTLTAFIGDRGDVDYLARKLQREGNAGRRWSAHGTAAALRRRLCERRLEDGREQIDGRLEPEDLDCGRVPNRLLDRYSGQGLPLFSHRMVSAPTWRDIERKERLPYLTRDTARGLWDAIGRLADEVRGSNGDLFYERVQQIATFGDYVTESPWEYGETEQTPEDKALRELVLPALIDACRQRATPGNHPEVPDRSAGPTSADAADPRPPCTNMSPPGFTGRWQDWHRGHGCDKDDGKPSTPDGAAEIASGGAGR